MASELNVVAGRTRTARFVRDNDDTGALYKKMGGLPTDLDRIVESGEKVELLSQARGATHAGGLAATLTLLQQFGALQKEYIQVMAVLQAVEHDLESSGAPADQITAVKQVLVNESPVVIRTIDKTDGSKKKVAVRSLSQEAIRAEIQKDASTILEMKEVVKLMAKRGVDAARIRTLKNDASELAGKLAARAAAKGASKGATAEMRQAVQDQKRVWAACYRILALVAQEDPRVKSLLAEASGNG